MIRTYQSDSEKVSLGDLEAAEKLHQSWNDVAYFSPCVFKCLRSQKLPYVSGRHGESTEHIENRRLKRERESRVLNFSAFLCFSLWALESAHVELSNGPSCLMCL